MYSGKKFRQITVVLTTFIIIVQMLTVSASAADGQTPTQNGNTEEIRSYTPYTLQRAYWDTLRGEANQKSSKQEDSSKDNSFSQLQLNQININSLSKYIPIDTISKEEFYRLNFNMEIASVAMTTENDLLIRTISNNYCKTKMQDDYVNALELTGVLEKGSSLKLNHQQPVRSDRSFGIFMLILTITFMSIFFVWYFYMYRKAFKADKLAVSTKDAGKNSAASVEKKITFNEVQGIDELKPDLFRLVDALENPVKYKKLGARPTKGMILYGPPGTGKTLIAKAISGEAGVPFFSASGSDFIEKYVGVGASRIRELYNKAKKSSPCIVFIDEIDAIGGNRGDSNNSERDQTINALLTELDGFAGTEGILTICATNRLDILDTALTRPGRFDLKIAVNLPDRQARYQILKLHSSGKKLAYEVDIDALAKKTNGFSGAELENLLNEAALIAAAGDQEDITNENIEDAFFKIIMNGHKKERIQNDEYAKLVAYHEAGHTLATKLLTNDGVSTVTIVQSTSGAGGVTFRSPEDVPLKSKKYLKNLVKVMYAGRAAEEMLLQSAEDITTGASQDIKQATEIIREYIGIYGMGNQGMIDMSQLTNQFNIIEEASRMANELYRETMEFLTENKKRLDRLAQALLDKETLDEAEIDSLIQSFN